MACLRDQRKKDTTAIEAQHDDKQANGGMTTRAAAAHNRQTESTATTKGPVQSLPLLASFRMHADVNGEARSQDCAEEERRSPRMHHDCSGASSANRYNQDAGDHWDSWSHEC